MSNRKFNLNRFHQAQESSFDQALEEIRNGRKVSHWMWYIFPQSVGLGKSETSRYYAINGPSEAAAYLADPVLRERLIRISSQLLKIKDKTAIDIFGSPDHLKLLSSMKLFSAVPGTDPVFERVIDRFYS